jgi:hypothetical protein
LNYERGFSREFYILRIQGLTEWWFPWPTISISTRLVYTARAKFENSGIQTMLGYAARKAES